jgi:hypothetical protein
MKTPPGDGKNGFETKNTPEKWAKNDVLQRQNGAIRTRPSFFRSEEKKTDRKSGLLEVPY